MSFYRKRDDVACVVHGDDFTFEGDPTSLQEVARDLAKVWLVKVRGVLGPDPGDDKAISILNRVVRWEKDHLRYEADPRHVEKLARDLGMENSKPYATPGVKPTSPSTILEDGCPGAAFSPFPQGLKPINSIARE